MSQTAQPSPDPASMRAMVLAGRGQRLREESRPIPAPAGSDVVIRIEACGVCRTDLHVQDGDIDQARYPVVPGHQVVGEVLRAGPQSVLGAGARVGAAWLARTCGECEFCRSGRENLCDRAEFHGCHRDGGFATHMLADSRYCLPMDRSLDAATATPLLCAGLIGFRSLRMAGDAKTHRHLRLRVRRSHRHPGCGKSRAGRCTHSRRPGTLPPRTLRARSARRGPVARISARRCTLDAALIFAPVGALVPKALRDVKKGGAVVCGGIHMSDIPSFPYRGPLGRTPGPLRRQPYPARWRGLHAGCSEYAHIGQDPDLPA